MKQVICPSCGAIVKNRSEVRSAGPGVHHAECERCHAEGLLDIDEDLNVHVLGFGQQPFDDMDDRSDRPQISLNRQQRDERDWLSDFPSMPSQSSQPYQPAQPTGRTGQQQSRQITYTERPRQKRRSCMPVVLIILFIWLVLIPGLMFILRSTEDHSKPESPARWDQEVAPADDQYGAIDYESEFSDEEISEWYETDSHEADETFMSVEMLDDFDKDLLAKLHEISIQKLKQSYLFPARDVAGVNYEPAAIYFYRTDYGYSTLTDVMRMTVTFSDGSATDYFVSVRFSNIAIREDGPPFFAFDGPWSYYGDFQEIKSDSMETYSAYVFNSLEGAQRDAAKDYEGIEDVFYDELIY